ncbi:MAG: lantibiotic dehydratase, partial [Saprospiraceae bacterium]
MPLSLPSSDNPNPAINLFPLAVIRRAGISFSVLDSLAWEGAAAEIELEKQTQAAAACRENLLQTLDQALRDLPANSLRLAIYNLRKAVYQGKTPRLPLNLLPQTLQDAADQWRAALESLHAQKNALESAYQASLFAAFHQLQAVAEDPDIQAALLYASHDLLRQLPALQKKPPEAWRKKEKQTALALARYVARAASKTTPFSRFGMVGLQQAYASETEFSDHKRAVSPNVGLLPAIYALLLQQPVFFRSLRVRLNACITRNSSPYTWLYYNGAEEGFQQSAGTPTLDALTGRLLELGRSAPFGTLSDYLQSITNANPEAQETWLLDLTDTGFLEWALPENGLSASWAGNLYQYLGTLPAEPIVVDTALLLQWLRTTARTLPYLDAPAGLEALQHAWSQVQAYFERYEGHCPDIPLERLFYEDVAYSQPVIVPEADLLDWARQLEPLRQSTAPHPLPPLH